MIRSLNSIAANFKTQETSISAFRFSKICPLLFLCLLGLSLNVQAIPSVPYDDEDTILIDRQPSNKIPYSKIVRAFAYKLFRIDSEKLTTFGSGKTNNVVRHFSEYADRTKTKFKVKRDEVELEFKLNF